MGALNRTCTCCRKRVHVALIRDTKVKSPVCLTCHDKRIAERVSYPQHISRGLPPKSQRMVRL